MPADSVKKKRRFSPYIAFLILCFSSLILYFLPFLYGKWEKGSLVLLAFQWYLLTPGISVFLSFRCGKKGVHPMAAAFPTALSLLFYPGKESLLMGFVCLVLSLVSCTAGQEYEKRKKEKKGGKRKS